MRTYDLLNMTSWQCDKELRFFKISIPRQLNRIYPTYRQPTHDSASEEDFWTTFKSANI